MLSRAGPEIDHLVYAVPDLAAGVAHLERLLGVRASPGGCHPAWGTRNALIALGDASYLEIIGPDPEGASRTEAQAAQARVPDASQEGSRASRPRIFAIEALTAPRLVTWAAKGKDLPRLVERARRHGVDLGAARPGSRFRSDGVLIPWTLTDPFMPRAGGVIPFFIDWGVTPHPAASAAPGCALVELRAEHPDAEAVRAMLRALGIALSVDRGPAPTMIVTLTSPRGIVKLV
jgi:hypothetical protein